MSKSMIHKSFTYGGAEHRQYLQQGYTIFDRFLTEDAIEFCSAQVERMASQLHDGVTAEAMINPHQLGERWFWELATDPKILDMIEHQIGPNILLWSGAVLAKPPRTGMEIKWHQDAPYWNVAGKLAGGIWIPLDEVDEDNGTMSILPGWHTKGVLPRYTDPDKDFFADEIDPKVLPTNCDQIKVTYNLKAGQMATHDTMLPHYSTPNRSDRWRRIMGFRYMAADGELGDKIYTSYRDGSSFPRRFFLVRGEDVKSHGLPRSPFDH